MRKPGGYSIVTDPALSRPQEADTFTCGHCQHVVFVKPLCDPADMGGRCTCCDKLICRHCVGKGCDPMEAKLLRMEARRSYEAAYG
jgi:hypothetical protein